MQWKNICWLNTNYWGNPDQSQLWEGMFITHIHPPAHLPLMALKRAILWTFNTYWFTWKPSPLFSIPHVTGQISIKTSYTTNTSSSQLLKYVNMYNWQTRTSDEGRIQSLIRDGPQHCKNINFRAKQIFGHKHTDGLDTKDWLIDQYS